MDHISEMSSYCQATEGAGTFAVMAGALAATMVACGFLAGRKHKKDIARITKNRNDYFEKHNIDESRRARYENEVYKNVCEDAENLIRTFATNPKTETARNMICGDIFSSMKSAIAANSADEPIGTFGMFDAKKVFIRFGVYNTSGDDGYYEIVDVSYKGRGMIAGDQLWSIGATACYDVAKGLVEALRDKYAEEIACDFVSIYTDSPYGVIRIS